MTRKVTISVPDELYEKMSKWRDSFNFSQVFQNAMTRMITRKEEFQLKLKEEFDFSSIIERLRKEKQEAENNYFEKGKKDALEWLKTAHYKDILYALKWNPCEKPEEDETLGDYFSQKLKKIYRLGLAEMRTQSSKVNRIIHNYIAGWQEGVQEFWDQVRDEVYAEY